MGTITIMVMGILCGAFVMILWNSPSQDLGKDAYLLIIGAFLSSVSAVMGFWFGKNAPKG